MGKAPRVVPAFRTVGSYLVAVGCGMPVRFLDTVAAVVRSGQLGGGASGKSGRCVPVPSATTSMYALYHDHKWHAECREPGAFMSARPQILAGLSPQHGALGPRRRRQPLATPGQACLRFRRAEGGLVGPGSQRCRVCLCLVCRLPSPMSQRAFRAEFPCGHSERCA